MRVLKNSGYTSSERLRSTIAWIERAWSAYYRRSNVCGIGHRGHNKPFLLLLESAGINNSVGIDGVVTTSEIEAGASHINLNWHEKLAPIIILPGCFLDPSVIDSVFLRKFKNIQEQTLGFRRIATKQPT